MGLRRAIERRAAPQNLVIADYEEATAKGDTLPKDVSKAIGDMGSVATESFKSGLVMNVTNNDLSEIE